METMARWVHRTKKTCWFSITNGFPWPHGIHLSCIWWCRRASVYCAISLGVQSENLGDWDRWQFRSEPIWTNHWLVTFLRCLQFCFFFLQRQFFSGHQSMAVQKRVFTWAIGEADGWHGIMTEKHVPQSESFRKWSVRQLCYQLAILQLFSSAINPMCFFPVLLAKVNTFRLAFLPGTTSRIGSWPEQVPRWWRRWWGIFFHTPELGGCKLTTYSWFTY